MMDEWVNMEKSSKLEKKKNKRKILDMVKLR